MIAFHTTCASHFYTKQSLIVSVLQERKKNLSLGFFVVAQFIVVTDDDHYCCLLQMPEEEAFAVFVRLMQEYRMRDMFKPTMAELGLCIYQLENLVQVTLWVLSHPLGSDAGRKLALIHC